MTIDTRQRIKKELPEKPHPVVTFRAVFPISIIMRPQKKIAYYLKQNENVKNG